MHEWTDILIFPEPRWKNKVPDYIIKMQSDTLNRLIKTRSPYRPDYFYTLDGKDGILIFQPDTLTFQVSPPLSKQAMLQAFIKRPPIYRADKHTIEFKFNFQRISAGEILSNFN